MPDAHDRLFVLSDDNPEEAVFTPIEKRRPVLERDPNGQWVRRVAVHSADKAYYVRRYADIVGKSMRKHWPEKLWWVELFAGPGRLYNMETGQHLNGSPLDALEIDYPFDGYVFADLDQRCVEGLKARVGGQPGVRILRGDANSASLHDEVAAIVPKDALVILYCDPEGLDLNFPTIRYFADRYRHLDLLLNFPVKGVVRALSAGHGIKAGRVLEHPDPRALLDGGIGYGPRVRDWFERQLNQLGYDHFESKTIRLHKNNVDIYDLMIASHSPRAIDFFRKATQVEPVGQYAFDLGDC